MQSSNLGTPPDVIVCPAPPWEIPGEQWLQWAALVLVPAAISILASRQIDARPSWAWRKLQLACWVAIPALFLSFQVEPGLLALMLSLPWALLMFSVSALGFSRFLARGFRVWHAGFADMACVHAGGAAVWLMAQRGGISVLGFHEPWVTWTAAHFLVDATLLLAILSHFGRFWRAAPRLPVLACALVVAFWLTALGIQFSPILERAGAWLMAAAALWAAFELLCHRMPKLLSPGYRLALDLAALSLVLGVSLAVAYTLHIWPASNLEFMASYHAGLNTLGFATLGLWVALFTPRREADSIPQLTRLRSTGRIHPKTPEDMKWIDGTTQARGIVDTLQDLAHAQFDARQVHPTIRDFYQDTASFEVHLRAEWTGFFRPFGKLWQRWARRQGQVNFAPANEGEHDLVSHIWPIHQSMDGRSNPRAWLRHFTASREVLYCAIYSTQPGQTAPLMNIGMPFRRFALTSILQMDPLADPAANAGGVQLSTAGKSVDAHCGIFVQAGPVTWRLPMHETLWLYPPNSDQSNCTAKHEVRVFGLLVMTMDYTLSPRADKPSSE